MINGTFGDVIIFVDNFADYTAFFVGLAQLIRHDKIFTIVGTERVYRRIFIEDALAGAENLHKVDDIYAKFPIIGSIIGRDYLVPAKAAVGERFLEVLRHKKADTLASVMADLANGVAPYVNRDAIRRRTPESKLSGGLMDFDRTVQRFINDQAELFYNAIERNWDWNSRYWEQLALLKLDRFLVSKDDLLLLQEAIQHARHAYSIEEHPLSLTTLAKMLFSAIDVKGVDYELLFREAWTLINTSIDIESRWTRLRPVVFIVCFSGVLAYCGAGGILSGDEADRLRAVISIARHRKIRSKKFFELRDQVESLLR